jgi:hypothetical protein
MAPNGNVRAGVQPSQIIGGGTFDIDPRSRKTHGANALSRGTFDPQMHRLVSGTPDSAAKTLLAIGNDFNIPVSCKNGLLDSSLKDPGIDPSAIFHTIYNYCRFV